MPEKKKNKIDLLLILPASLLLVEVIVVVVLLATGYEINQPSMFFLFLLALFLIFQIWRQLSSRLRVKRALSKIDDVKALIDSERPFETIKLLKDLLLKLPQTEYLDALTMLEELYRDNEMDAAVQQVKAIRSESLNFFEMTKNLKKATGKDRRDWQTRAFKLQKMVKALPTEPDQDLSDIIGK